RAIIEASALVKSSIFFLRVHYSVSIRCQVLKSGGRSNRPAERRAGQDSRENRRGGGREFKSNDSCGGRAGSRSRKHQGQRYSGRATVRNHEGQLRGYGSDQTSRRTPPRARSPYLSGRGARNR